MDDSETNSLPSESAPELPEAAKSKDGGRKREGAWETMRSLLVVLIIVICFRTFVAEATVVPTGSMEQKILIGDHVF